MKEVTKWVATDGTVFDLKKECEEYERHIVMVSNAINTLKQHCKDTSCATCLYWDDIARKCKFRESNPNYWDF